MRRYKCKHTGEVYECRGKPHTDELKMINERIGEELKDFLTCAFTPLTYKFWNQETIKLDPGELINLDLCPGRRTHKKFSMQKRFIKINP